jgi:hypothetical protein
VLGTAFGDRTPVSAVPYETYKNNMFTSERAGESSKDYFLSPEAAGESGRAPAYASLGGHGPAPLTCCPAADEMSFHAFGGGAAPASRAAVLYFIVFSAPNS